MLTTGNDWTKPAALAIPKEGYFEIERGRYGPVFPRTPACYGFSIIAKVKEDARTRSANTARPSKQRSPKRRSSSRHYACTTCAGCSSTSAMA
jgi:hypothetical protein